MYKIGYSIDIHNLESSNVPQKLGSVLFELGYKVIAHSDGDIILHAIAEAILGALGLGDLGDHFADTNIDYKDMDSLTILNYSINQMYKLNYGIGNIDLTLISEQIHINPIKKQIKEKLCNIFNTNDINIKATKFEKPSNQIQCNCAILLKKIL